MITFFERKDNNYNERIAAFMNLKRDKKGYWEHPCEFAISQSLYFHEEWDWLMPVILKIQTEFKDVVSFSETRRTLFGTITELGIKEENEELVYYYVWDDFSEETNYDDSIIKCDTKFEALFRAVWKFVEWWEINKDTYELQHSRTK